MSLRQCCLLHCLHTAIAAACATWLAVLSPTNLLAHFLFARSFCSDILPEDVFDRSLAYSLIRACHIGFGSKSLEGSVTAAPP